ncbi:MAG: DUF86 domain-containing protein [Candidatus Magasanikbacteria bacterium]|nr:DUF86 domain-containing protein [Candidatus Magasanikbacteria bacterium]
MKDQQEYIDHILASIAAIKTYVEPHTKQSFFRDAQAQDAVIRRLEIIGEAARHLSDALTSRTSHIEWRAVKAMRNFLIHEYFNVDLNLVWNVAQKDLPVMKKVLSELKGI